ncbi:MAG: response regulator transcription factor [Deltaproteobacteria bacterium]|nr:response regulator transcription factor [Deltaproteobacteria bacterium]
MPLKKENPKVLIIEDEMQMRFYLMTLVKSLGFDPILAKDGVQGLDTLKHIRPDTIILDIMMPEKGGAKVYQELARNPLFKSIPVVFFSGVDRKAFSHYIKMLNLNLEHDIPDPGIYIAKNADPEYLKEAIKTCVSKDTP